MTKVPYIVSAIMIALVALFAILEKYWTGFIYFVLGSLLLLSVFWGVWLIISYLTVYKHERDERFLLYKAELINHDHITSEYFEQNKSAYKKAFEKKLTREKISRIYMIAFCFALAVAFLFGMIYI